MHNIFMSEPCEKLPKQKSADYKKCTDEEDHNIMFRRALVRIYCAKASIKIISLEVCKYTHLGESIEFLKLIKGNLSQ